MRKLYLLTLIALCLASFTAGHRQGVASVKPYTIETRQLVESYACQVLTGKRDKLKELKQADAAISLQNVPALHTARNR